MTPDIGDQALVTAALAGRAEGPTLKREDARKVAEARVYACQRVTGMTPAALSTQDPTRYAAWLSGTVKALRRASLVSAGDISAKELQWLWRREKARRSGAEVDAVNDSFDDMFDSALEDPRMVPASREFLDDGEERERFP